jgi:hypothetical protein
MTRFPLSKFEVSRCFLVIVMMVMISMGALTSAAQAADKPNVVVMMVDNLGWGELGVIVLACRSQPLVAEGLSASRHPNWREIES